MLMTTDDIKEHVEKGLLVQDMVNKDQQIQQCGVDLTVGKVFTLEGKGVLDFTNEKRKLPEYKEITSDNDVWNLSPGIYHFAMNEKIVIPKSVAGLLLPRSSALTCGLEVHTAVWDPGYEGRSFMHVNLTKEIEIHKNAKVAQMIFFNLGRETSAYDGKYKSEDILKFAKRGV
jgi:dUTP pyrophosphatase